MSGTRETRDASDTRETRETRDASDTRESLTPGQRVRRAFEQSGQVLQATAEALAAGVEDAAGMVGRAVTGGHAVLIFGNGGSAAQAQHLAAELVGRFRLERPALPALALTTDTSILTAVANDYAFEQVFARQVQALARPGDLLWALSTSGQSPSVLEALRAGRAAGCASLALGGRGGGPMAELADLCLVVPADDTARIQEAHLLLGHIICELVEVRVHSPGTGPPATFSWRAHTG